MRNIHHHITKHTKTLVHHSKKILHHGAKLAHHHRHMLLTYVHIFLLMLCFGYYNLDGHMFAQEIETTPTEITTTTESSPETSGDTPTVESEPTANNESPITSETTGTVPETQTLTSPEIISGTIVTGTDTGDISSNLTGSLESGAITTGEILSGTTRETLQTTGNSFSEITGNISTSTTDTLYVSPETITSPTDFTGLLARGDANETGSLTLIENHLLVRKDKTNLIPIFKQESYLSCPLFVSGAINTYPGFFFSGTSIEKEITFPEAFTLFMSISTGNNPFQIITLTGNDETFATFFSGTTLQLSGQQGFISEFLLYNSILATGEIQWIQTYLGAKYLTFSAPAFPSNRENTSTDTLPASPEIPTSPTIPNEKEQNSRDAQIVRPLEEKPIVEPIHIKTNHELTLPEISETISTDTDALHTSPEVATGNITTDTNSIDENTGISILPETTIPEENHTESNETTSKEITGTLSTLDLNPLKSEIPVFDKSLIPEEPATSEETPLEALTGDLLLESTNTLSGNTAEVFIPEGTVFTNGSGEAFTGDIQDPVFTGDSVANELTGLDIISTIKVGADEQIRLQDLSGNQINATFTVPAPGLNEGDTIVINYSQDGNTRYHLDNVAVTMINGAPYAVFQANHFTIFSLGVWSGTFMINNNATVTTGTSVCLQTVISGAIQMKFGNTTGTRDSANWTGFSGNYCGWNLTGADGEQTVYAMFSGNGNLAYIQDSIVLDTSNTTTSSGLQSYINGTKSGTTGLIDQSGKNRNFSGSLLTGSKSGETILTANGTNQYAELGSGFITAYPFSVSLWVKPDRVTGTQGLIMFGNSGATNMYRGLQLSTTTAQIVARNTTARTANGTVTMTAGKWYHIVGVFASATSRTIYVNAITGASSTNSVTFATTNPTWRIARYPNTTTNYFSGGLDEIRIYNKTLTYKDISTLYMEKPSMANETVYTTTPVLQGAAPDPQMQISLTISGSTYPATNNQNGTWSAAVGPLLSGTYNVIFNYSNIYGATGTYTSTGALKVQPLRNIIYSPAGNTFGSVTATLTGYQTGTRVTNNSGSYVRLFTGNGSFVFNVQDFSGNEYQALTTVSWIKKGQITLSTTGFNENSAKNDGSIGNTITINLTGDTFASTLISNNLISLSNVPTGLTGSFTLSGTNTLLFTLSGNATNHTNTGSIANLSISFLTGAFATWTPSDIIASTTTGIAVNFIDPYVGFQGYPTADTMLDADTDAADGCADGVCQEHNYGATNYLCASDFGAKIMLKFNVASIPTGSVVTSASLRLTKYYISAASPGTGFKLKKLINNNDWIEGTKDNAAAGIGEPNYKMKQRGQTSWYNGNIGLVQGIDYASPDLTDTYYFSGSLTADVTQNFPLNADGLAAIQDWLDTPSNNGGFMMTDADLGWLCIHSKEFATVANQPLLTVQYAPNTSIPKIINLDPANNETGISLSNNLLVTFDEKVKAYSGSVIIKRLSNNAIVETIATTGSQVTINNTIITINPTNDFASNSGYYVEISSGAFRDYAGNAFTGFAGSGTRKFTTVNTSITPAVTGATFTGITDSSARFSATMTKTGSSAITERGFFRSTTNGFNDGDGTKVSELGSWTTTGTYSLTGTSLPAGTQIYIKAFVTNTQGIGYSTQTGFLTKPAQVLFDPATNIDNDAFQINWNTSTGATNYKLYVSTDIGLTTLMTGYTPKLLSGTLTNRTLTGLAKNTTYYYKILANNTAGDSVWSLTTSTTTSVLPTPRARLKFEETAGSIAYDSSPNNNNGVLLGGPLMGQSGIDNYAFGFDGINDDVSLLDFDYGPSLTVSFRFKTTTTGDDVHLFSHGNDTGANSLNVILNNSDKTIRTYVNGNQNILNLNGTTYPTLINGQRHMYTVTIDDNGSIAGKKNITVYIDGKAKASDSSLTAGTFNPTNNFTLARRSTNQSGSYYSGYLDDFRIYNKAITSGEIQTMYSNLDITPPTANISYSPDSGTCISGNVTATLTGYSEFLTITNNSGSAIHTFTDNGTYTFQFIDNANNTGETTATVSRICRSPVSIGAPSLITSGVKVADVFQMIEQRFPDYFWVEDPNGNDAGYYTTISITDLSGSTDKISNNYIQFKANNLTTITGDINSRVSFGAGITNYQPLNGTLTYIKRDTASNLSVKGKYGDIPRLQVNIPAYQTIDNYHATFTYTLYEN